MKEKHLADSMEAGRVVKRRRKYNHVGVFLGYKPLREMRRRELTILDSRGQGEAEWRAEAAYSSRAAPITSQREAWVLPTAGKAAWAGSPSGCLVCLILEEQRGDELSPTLTRSNGAAKPGYSTGPHAT